MRKRIQWYPEQKGIHILQEVESMPDHRTEAVFKRLMDASQSRKISKLCGLRSVGKRYAIQQYQAYCKDHSIYPNGWIELDYSGPANTLPKTALDLYEYIIHKIGEYRPWSRTAILINEPDAVEDLEYALAGLLHWSDLDLFVLTSQADVLPEREGSPLRDQIETIKLFPLSFKEYCEGRRESLSELFLDYMEQGGLPLALSVSAKERQDVLENLYDSILLHSLVENLRYADVELMQQLTVYMASQSGEYISGRGTSHLLRTRVKKASVNTVSAYMEALQNSYLINVVKCRNLLNNQIFERERKYYFADTGLLSSLLSDGQVSPQGVLENIVWLEFRRRGYSVMTGRHRHSIIDFVTEKDGMRTCWQLLASVHETELFEEKLKALESLDDNCDRVMMTLDPQAELPEGIRFQELLSFLLEKE